jgi:Xaa-Pro aminopeptidase
MKALSTAVRDYRHGRLRNVICAHRLDALLFTSADFFSFASHLLHRSGHGIGVVQHDFPEDVPFNGRPLEAGELYAVEPGLYVPGVGGFRCADVALVGPRAQRLPAPPGCCVLHRRLIVTDGVALERSACCRSMMNLRRVA